MPWFPELSTTSTYSQPAAMQVDVVPFYEGILGIPPHGLVASWAVEPHLDDPRGGAVRGRAELVAWAEQTRAWLGEGGATVRPVYLLKTASRTVEEVVLELTVNGERRDLPVATVAERETDGRLTAIRIYHSLWPLIEGHVVRAPLLARVPGLAAPDVVGDYQRALAAGDLEAVLACYEDDAVVREPAGGPYRYTGMDELRHIYGLQFADGAGIPLEHCTITDDGRACALEYNVVRWGHTPMTPQPGIAVYERGDSGKLAYGRIDDDAAPPEASDSSKR